MNRTVAVSSLVVLTALVAACDKSDKPSASPAASASVTIAAASAATSASSAPAAASASGAPPAGSPLGVMAPAVAFVDVGLATPESVLYDATDDVYLVSNIQGSPVEHDGVGFISRLSPDGKVTALKWIESGKNKVKLDAPKGMTLVGDVLYVADLDTVRMFDRKTGAPTGEVKIAGATFLNDVALGADGKVYVSDSGLKGGAKGFDPSGTDAVYVIEKGKTTATPVAKSADLGRPNGLLAAPEKTWVATFGTGELYALDAKGKKSDAEKLPTGSLDGIVQLPGGELLVSSWDGSAIYRGKPGGPWVTAIANVKSPADIGFDTKRSRVLVPLFTENQVRAYDIKTTN